ncbi:MAG: hypothetical protein ABI169_15015 [Chitinophagaceae bacterium]
MDKKNPEFNQVQFYSSNSVVVINPTGKLKQLFTPFQVTQRTNSELRCYIVDEVRTTEDDKLVYIINGTAYFHHHFTIDVRF